MILFDQILILIQFIILISLSNVSIAGKNKILEIWFFSLISRILKKCFNNLEIYYQAVMNLTLKPETNIIGTNILSPFMIHGIPGVLQ